MPAPDVTQLLSAIDAGDPKAADQLLPLVYEELRKLAAVRMANEKAGQTLQPTALVHEAWLKVAGDGNEHFANRRHFFKAAAGAMQQILIDIARRKQRHKHGAHLVGDELHESRIAMPVPSEELLAVNDALANLAIEDSQDFGTDEVTFTVTSANPNANPNSRTYASFTDAALDVVEARILQGIHTRSADLNGRHLGNCRQVGLQALTQASETWLR